MVAQAGLPGSIAADQLASGRKECTDTSEGEGDDDDEDKLA